MKRFINFMVSKLFNFYFRKKQTDIVIRFRDEEIELDSATKLIQNLEEEKKIEEYLNQYW